MKLTDKLKKIKNLNTDTLLNVTCVDDTVIVGYFREYISAMDNEPEIPQLDVYSETNHTLYGLLETEIKSIEIVKNK